jgi:plasmid rolling circle replication initiator protein Rep
LEPGDENPNYNTYHPHIHAIAAVDRGYFKKSNANYISHDDLRELWRDACGLDYLPQCRIERVRNTKRKQVAEVAKYTVKSADYIDRPSVVETLDLALHRKRLIAYGGLFKAVKTKLELPDEDVAVPDIPPEFAIAAIVNPVVRKLFFEWQNGAYLLVSDSHSWGQGV